MEIERAARNSDRRSTAGVRYSLLELGLPGILLVSVVGIWFLWAFCWAPMLRSSIEATAIREHAKVEKEERSRQDQISTAAVTVPPARTTSASGGIGGSGQHLKGAGESNDMLAPAASQPSTFKTENPAMTQSPALIGPAPSMLEQQATRLQAAVETRFVQLGQTGDLFGGVNAIFAALAVVGVFWAAVMQWRTMSESRHANAIQRFETAFFELLKLTREISERIEFQTASGEKKSGSSALNALAYKNFHRRSFFLIDRSADFNVRALRLQSLVDKYKKEIYSKNPSTLGPYWRLLYQTFELIDQSPLSGADKDRFSKIARGQMGDGAVLLLGLNGLTWRGRSFVRHIEHYGLLEHMHPTYKRLYERFLEVTYSRNAFRGSAERASHSDDPNPPIAYDEFDKDPSSPDFMPTSPITIGRGEEGLDNDADGE